MIDIPSIREELNELQFRNGRRQVLIGRISDVIEVPRKLDEDDETSTECDNPEVTRFLDQLVTELQQHDLQLVRDENNPDELYAVQHLRPASKVDLSWMAGAMTWAYRITAVGLMTIIPGLVGMGLDSLFGSSFLAILGFMAGLPISVYYLILLTRQRDRCE